MTKEEITVMPYEDRVEVYLVRIIDEFSRNPELFLTESDLKCRLYKELDSDPVLSCEEQTGDGEKRTNYVHTETPYFVFGKLNKNRVDVTVVKPSNYKFLNKKIVNRKSFFFTEPSIGIKLKLNKKKGKTTMEKELRQVLNDLTQLKNTRPESTFYVLFLDKKRLFSNKQIGDIQNEYGGIRLFYAKN